MKKIMVAALLAPFLTGSAMAIGIAGTTFNVTWSITAQEKAFAIQCSTDKESGECTSIREQIAEQLENLADSILGDDPELGAMWKDVRKRALHDLDQLMTHKKHYSFQLKIAGGPQWSSDDIITRGRDYYILMRKYEELSHLLDECQAGQCNIEEEARQFISKCTEKQWADDIQLKLNKLNASPAPSPTPTY